MVCYMTENINEKYLSELAKKLGITVKHGWKTALQKRLRQKNLTIITTWLSDGVPKDFRHILENAGIDPDIWRQIVRAEWNQEIFYNNILRIIDECCGGDPAIFNDKIGSPYANVRWKTDRPSPDSIAAVVLQFMISRHWLLTGEGKMLDEKNDYSTSDDSPTPNELTPEAVPPYLVHPNPESQQRMRPAIDEGDLIRKTVTVLKSKTPFSSALKENIESFHYAVECVGNLNTANKRIDEMEVRLKTIEARLPEVKE